MHSVWALLISALFISASCFGVEGSRYGWKGSLRKHGVHSCIVSLISQHWAVTAERCVSGKREDMTVLLGGDKQGARQVYGVLANVTQSSKPGMAKSQEAGLALIKIWRPVELSNRPEEVVALSSNTTGSSCLQLDCYQLKRITWQMEVHTADIWQAGTDAHVYVNVYGRTSDGSDKNTGPIELDNQKNRFERGRVDKFTVEAVDIGVPYKLRVWHDNTGCNPGWRLGKIVLKNYDIKKAYTFPCGRWLARTVDDREIVRELPAHASDIAEHERGASWQIEVHTSNIMRAGTDATIKVKVYGRTFDGIEKNTGSIRLDNRKKYFERGRVDKFVLATVDIGVPYKLRVWHDNRGFYSGWHLEKIVLKNYDTEKTYTFPCDRWLARDEDDGRIERELLVQANDIAKPVKVPIYKLFVHTGTMALAGTNANVHVHLFGSQGSSGARWLKNSKNNKDPFEQGSVDEFHLEAVDLKKLQKLRVFHDNKKIAPGWFLEKIVVQVDGKEGTQTTTFPCNKWLAEDEGDGRISRDLSPEGSTGKGAAWPKVRKLAVRRSQMPLTPKLKNVKKNHCMADFGAALVCKNGTELLGVVASSTPGQYASIPKARAWIRNVTGV